MRSVLVHGVPHDVVGVGGEALHGVVDARRLLGVEGLLHVGRAVGHWQGQGVVAGGGASLGSLAESGAPIGEPHLEQRQQNILTVDHPSGIESRIASPAPAKR